MPDPIAPVAEPSLINEPAKAAPAEVTPESKLFPAEEAPKPKADEPAKPDESAPKPDAPKPEDKPKDEPKKEEPKPGEPKPSADANKAPVDYENLKLPDGSLLSAADLEALKKDAKESGLTLEDAQGVLEVKSDAVKAYAQRQTETLQAVRKEWRANWEKDPVYGGEKLNENTELARRGWDWFADNELKMLADQTGFGDHPAVLKALARLGKLFAEDSNIRGTLGGTPKEKSPEEKLYGATTPGAEAAA
jgi:hypothetical protein